jgi:hypothetical protein
MRRFDGSRGLNTNDSRRRMARFQDGRLVHAQLRVVAALVVSLVDIRVSRIALASAAPSSGRGEQFRPRVPGGSRSDSIALFLCSFSPSSQERNRK